MDAPGKERWKLGDQDLERLLAESKLYKGESLWSDAWRRLRKNRPSFWSLVFLGIFGSTAVLAPILPIPSPIALSLQKEATPPDWPWGSELRYEDEAHEPGTRPTETVRNFANDGWRHRAVLAFATAEETASNGALLDLVDRVSGRAGTVETRPDEDTGGFVQHVSVPLRDGDPARVVYGRTQRRGRVTVWSVPAGEEKDRDDDDVVYELELEHDLGALERWSVEAITRRGSLFLVPKVRDEGVVSLRYDFTLPRHVRGNPRLLVLNGVARPIDSGDTEPAAVPERGEAEVETATARESRGIPHDDLEKRVARALAAEPIAGVELLGVKVENGYWELGGLDRAMLDLRGRIFGLWQTGNWMGTDAAGRDIVSRIIWGSRTSILVALAATACSLLIGVIYGAFSGLKGGRVDNLMMRIVDVLYSVPFIFIVIFLITIVNEYRTELEDVYGIDRELIFYVVIGAIYWLTMARVVRGQVLSLKNTEFIEAARVVGASTWRILIAHLVPNVLSIVIVYLTLTIPAVMLFEAFLSFLGLGIEPPKVSWGLLAVDGQEAVNAIHIYWWLIVFPAGAMGSTLLALNILGDGLRDALDPKMRGKD